MPDPQLSNIREHLGWLIGRAIVDVTADDPPAIPDAEEDESGFIVLHFDNGATLTFPIYEEGLSYDNPDEPDDAEPS